MKSKITEFLSRELLTGRLPGSLEPHDDLLASGLLDSLGVMQLVWFMEREFEVQVPPEDVTIEHFQSIDSIAAYLEARKAVR